MCKARLKAKFKSMCVTMYSLVMSPFSRDNIKVETYFVDVYSSIHTAPGF